MQAIGPSYILSHVKRYIDSQDGTEKRRTNFAIKVTVKYVV